MQQHHPPSDPPRSVGPGLTFSEAMKGAMAVGATSFEGGRADGERSGSTLQFELEISVPDLDRAAADPATPCQIDGVVHAPVLSAAPLRVVEGTFRLMVPDPNQVETMHMRYEMTLESEEGTRYDFDGFKVIRTEPPWRAWPATTTLHVRIRGGTGPDALGIITIGPRAFVSLLRSMELAAGTPRLRGLRAKTRFARAFVGRLASRYATTLDLAGRFDPGVPTGHRDLRVPMTDRRWRGSDGRWHDGAPGQGADLALTRHRGGAKGPVLLAAGFGMQGSSFAMPTVDTTLTEHLAEAGYDVWLFDYRASIALPSCRTSFTIDDIALDDWPAAVAEVRRITEAPSVQLLGHCVGSVTILMALLAGMEGVRSAVCSQFSAHPRPGWLNRTKNALRVSQVLEGMRIRGIDENSAPTAPNKALDLVLALIPVPRGERCGRPVCRWLNATYGLTHTHTQLNEATHEMLDEAFGYGNLAGLKHLSRMHRAERAVSHTGEDSYLPHVDRLSMPILFLQGSLNPIFRPAGTRRTVAWINDHHGPGHASYQEFPAYSHLDTMIGRDAATEVFPAIVAHLDATNG
jgi:cholesterol oxidase